MPKLAEKEMEDRIASGAIFAISIDTSIFDRYQCNLDYAALRKLDQFRESYIEVLISEVVANEVKSHIERDAVKSQRELKSAFAAHMKRWKLALEDALLAASANLDQPARTAAEEQFDAYRHLHHLGEGAGRISSKLRISNMGQLRWRVRLAKYHRGGDGALDNVRPRHDCLTRFGRRTRVTGSGSFSPRILGLVWRHSAVPARESVP